MPDRPSDDYGWLYGGSQQPPPGTPSGAQDDDNEHTRLIPTAPRPGSSRGSSAERPPILPRSGSGGSGGPRGSNVRWGKVILGLIVLWIIFLIAVPLYAWSQVDKINAIPKGGPADQPGTNYLLVGSDSRKGLTKEENRKLGTGGVAVDAGRTDTIMVLHTGSGPSMLMSIPRDSEVPIPGHGTTKINSAFTYGGPRLLTKTIEQDTGLHIDHYVEIGLGGFVRVVNAVGGVQICPHHKINDRRANLHVKKGCQSADGATALGWARSRHAFALGDIQREEHQRQIVNQIGHKLKSPWTFINPFRYWGLGHAAAVSLRVSKGTSIFSIANFGLAMSRVNGSSGLTCGIPIANLSVQWDHTRALQLLRYLKTDRTADIPKSLCTRSGLPR